MSKLQETELPGLPFSRDWSKLNDRMFTTIRKPHHPYTMPEATIFQVVTPTRTFRATLAFSTETALEDLSTDLLTYDTDSDTRERAISILNGFYRIPPVTVQLMLLTRFGAIEPRENYIIV